ncbi:caspase family protein [Spirosoma arcticum]
MSRTVIALLSVLVLLAGGPVARCQTLHFIAFADTDDIDIGSNNMKTYAALTGGNGLASTIAEQAKLKLRSVGFYGTRCRMAELDNALNELTVGPDDVVFFYFVGHGFNNRQNEYPSLIFGKATADPATIDASARNLRELYARIRAKKPRLTIVVGDACNKERTDPPAKVSSARTIDVMPPQNLNPDRFRDLFRNWQGGILMSSSRRNQFSHTDAKGGWMSVSFQNALNNWCATSRKGAINWKPLLDDVVLRTETIARQNSQEQNPQYEQDLKPYAGGTADTGDDKRPVTKLCPPMNQFVNEIALAGIRDDMPLLSDMYNSITTDNAQQYAEVFSEFYANQKPFYERLEQLLFNRINDLSPACQQQFTRETDWLKPSMLEINRRYDVIQKYAGKPTQLVHQARSDLPSIINRLKEILDRLEK